MPIAASIKSTAKVYKEFASFKKKHTIVKAKQIKTERDSTKIAKQLSKIPRSRFGMSRRKLSSQNKKRAELEIKYMKNVKKQMDLDIQHHKIVNGATRKINKIVGGSAKTQWKKNPMGKTRKYVAIKVPQLNPKRRLYDKLESGYFRRSGRGGARTQMTLSRAGIKEPRAVGGQRISIPHDPVHKYIYSPRSRAHGQLGFGDSRVLHRHKKLTNAPPPFRHADKVQDTIVRSRTKLEDFYFLKMTGADLASASSDAIQAVGISRPLAKRHDKMVNSFGSKMKQFKKQMDKKSEGDRMVSREVNEQFRAAGGIDKYAKKMDSLDRKAKALGYRSRYHMQEALGLDKMGNKLKGRRESIKRSITTLRGKGFPQTMKQKQQSWNKVVKEQKKLRKSFDKTWGQQLEKAWEKKYGKIADWERKKMRRRAAYHWRRGRTS